VEGSILLGAMGFYLLAEKEVDQEKVICIEQKCLEKQKQYRKQQCA
jgi:hypothetical protein